VKPRVLALFAAVLLASVASAQFYNPKQKNAPIPGERQVTASGSNAGVRIEQKLNGQVPLNLEFDKEDGTRIKLGDVVKDRPTILLLVFFDCVGICTMELSSLVETLNGFKNDEDVIGELANVVVVSINPQDDVEMARLKKEAYLALYEREETDASWHYLTGEMPNIRKLADSIGYSFKYEETDADPIIVHPAALTVLTPEGQISKYFLDTQYQAKPLLSSLQAAAVGEIGERDTTGSILACIQIDGFTSALSKNIWKTTVFMALAFMIFVGAWIFKMSRTTPPNKTEGGPDSSGLSDNS
jgi:protein SCO1/2